MTDLVAGHIQVLFVDIGPSMELIRAGKARALGITSAEAAAAAPEIPPLAKVGVPGFDTTAWQMIVAPGRHAAADPGKAQRRDQRHRQHRRRCRSRSPVSA